MIILRHSYNTEEPVYEELHNVRLSYLLQYLYKSVAIFLQYDIPEPQGEARRSFSMKRTSHILYTTSTLLLEKCGYNYNLYTSNLRCHNLDAGGVASRIYQIILYLPSYIMYLYIPLQK